MNSNHETDAAYTGLVARLNDDWRVVAGSCGIQWILQRRSGDQWHNKSFLRSRAGLLLYATSYEVDAEPDALAVLEALPERFPEARKRREEVAP
jgi:hypothetical protein